MVVAYSSLGSLHQPPSSTFVKVYLDPAGEIFTVTCARGICSHYLQAKIRADSASDLSALKDRCKHLCAIYESGIFTPDYVKSLHEAFEAGRKVKKDTDVDRAYFDITTGFYEWPSLTIELMRLYQCAGEKSGLALAVLHSFFLSLFLLLSSCSSSSPLSLVLSLSLRCSL